MNTNPESVAVPTRADSPAQSALKVRLTRLLAEDDPANYSHDLTNEDVDHIVDLVLGVVESWAERDIEGIDFVAANRIALAARHFCEELQEDGEGVPQLELKELNAALDAWEAYPDARGTFDDTQPILAALTSLVEDQHATDHQRRVAHLALSELRRIAAAISDSPAPVDAEAMRRALEKVKAMRDKWKYGCESHAREDPHREYCRVSMCAANEIIAAIESLEIPATAAERVEQGIKETPIEEAALRLFHAFRRENHLAAAQLVAHLMEIYYSNDESLMSDAAIRLETLAGMSDQEWPAIIGLGDDQ